MSYAASSSADRTYSPRTRYFYGSSHAIETGDVISDAADQPSARPASTRRRRQASKIQEYRLPPSSSVANILAQESQRDALPPLPSKTNHRASVTFAFPAAISNVSSTSASRRQAIHISTTPLPSPTHADVKSAVGKKDDRFEAFLARTGKAARPALQPTAPSLVSQKTVRRAPSLPSFRNKPVPSSPPPEMPLRPTHVTVPAASRTRSNTLTSRRDRQSFISAKSVENPYVLPDLDLGFDSDRKQQSITLDKRLSSMMEGLAIRQCVPTTAAPISPVATPTAEVKQLSFDRSSETYHSATSRQDLWGVGYPSSPELARNERMALLTTSRSRLSGTGGNAEAGHSTDTSDVDHIHHDLHERRDGRSSASGLRRSRSTRRSSGGQRAIRARSSSLGAAQRTKLQAHPNDNPVAVTSPPDVTPDSGGNFDVEAALTARAGASRTVAQRRSRSVDTDEESDYGCDGARVTARGEVGATQFAPTAETTESSLRHRSITAPTGHLGPVSPYEHVAARAHLSPRISPQPSSDNTWRNSLGQDAYASLNSYITLTELRRQEVIWELCRTEEAFVNGLHGVIRVFCDPLCMLGGEWIPGIPAQITDLFDWLADIAALHSSIASNMARYAASQGPLVMHIAQPFLATLTKLEVHQAYLIAFEGVNETIKRLVDDKSSELGEFIRIQQRLPDCGAMTLSSFLLKPVQRLMKFPLFFGQLLSLTPAEHVDRHDTYKLHCLTDSIIRTMEEVKQREDEYTQLKTFAANVSGLPTGFKLAKRDRRLLYSGSLRQVQITEREQHVLGIDTATGTFSLLRESTVNEFGVRSRSTTVNQTHLRPDSVYSQGYDTSSSAASLPSPAPPSLARLSPSASSDSASIFSRSFASRLRASTSNGALRAISPHLSRSSRSGSTSKARESPMHVFVFTDLVVFANRVAETSALKTRSSSRDLRASKLSPSTSGSVVTASPLLDGSKWEINDDWALARIIGVHDLAHKSEHHPGLLSVDLLPIWTDSASSSRGDEVEDGEEDEEGIYTRTKSNKKSAWESAMRTSVFLIPDGAAASKKKRAALDSERSDLIRALAVSKEEHQRGSVVPPSVHTRTPSEIDADIRAKQCEATNMARARRTTSSSSGCTAATLHGALTYPEHQARHASLRSFWSHRVQSVKRDILDRQDGVKENVGLGVRCDTSALDGMPGV